MNSLESHSQFLTLSDYPITGEKEDGCTPGYKSVRDGKTYQIKTFRGAGPVITIKDLVKEYFGIKFGELMAPGRKCFPKTTVVRDADSWAICSKWIDNTEPLVMHKLKGNEKLKKISRVNISKESSRLIINSGTLFFVKKGSELAFPLKHGRSYDSTIPPGLKLFKTPNELFYRGLPIENLTRIFTIIKILNMVDIKPDHILVKKKGDHYRATLIDTFASLKNRLTCADLMHPFVYDDDTLLTLPYLVESEVWETVDAFLTISQEKVFEVLSAVPNLLTEEEVNELAQSIFSTQKNLSTIQRSRPPLSKKDFLKFIPAECNTQALPQEVINFLKK
ncbi:MAG: hypothetical protein CK425_12925 [Parachlamydia sp.]|nr:MAG: hypothetical protein CK425_12925 [Parachlamydia sp.]